MQADVLAVEFTADDGQIWPHILKFNALAIGTCNYFHFGTAGTAVSTALKNVVMGTNYGDQFGWTTVKVEGCRFTLKPIEIW